MPECRLNQTDLGNRTPIHRSIIPFTVKLGPVDGFDQDEGASESDESAIAVLGFVAAHGISLEALQLADRLLDPGTGLVEQSRKEPGLFLAFSRYGMTGIMPRRRQAARLAAEIIAFVGDRDTRPDIGSYVERDFKLRGVADLAAGQMESDGQAVKVGLEVDFRGEPAPRTAQRLIFLPPFAPAAETCARTTVLSKNCTTCAVLLVSARSCRNASNTPERLSRQNRFQMLFQLPNSAGSARQVMLCTGK